MLSPRKEIHFFPLKHLHGESFNSNQHNVPNNKTVIVYKLGAAAVTAQHTINRLLRSRGKGRSKAEAKQAEADKEHFCALIII